MAKAKKCRVCDEDFFEGPLLRYENMPKAAQYLPDKNGLKSDKGVDLEVCQCSGCGLVQLNNEPVPYYKEVIRAAAVSGEMIAFRRKQFADFVKGHSLKGKKIIEIGCGRGEYLSIMRRTGADVYGVEYSAESAAECANNGLNVEQGFVGSGSHRLKNAPFEAFFMLNYLEHLPEPNVMLQKIRGDLIGNAVGLVEVPNFDMIIKKKMFAEFISDHLFYFTQGTLRTALELNGFEVIESNEVWYSYIISAVVRKTHQRRGLKPLSASKKLDLSDFEKYRANLKSEMENYISRFKGKKVAVWGAGHQALAVISLMNIAGNIKYVVDSAPFKQGKYTPATHIPIVPPEMLKSDPVDAVIVMAASYSDEVAGLVKAGCGGRIGLAILRADGLEKIQ